MTNVEAIARATPRLEALIFGPGDYSASQGVRQSAAGGDSNEYPGDIWHYARNKIVIAARTAGIEAVDGPYANFRNPDGYRRQCTWAVSLGFVGKWAIHPSQIEIANEVFSPTPQQVERARKMVAAYAEAERQGLGAIAVDGVMVDAVIFRAMQPIIAKADAIGM